MKDEIRNIWVVGILLVIVFGVIIASIFESGFKEQIADDKKNDRVVHPSPQLFMQGAFRLHRRVNSAVDHKKRDRCISGQYGVRVK